MGYYMVKFDNIVTSFSFYNKILPRLHSYFVMGIRDEIMFDFSDVEFVQPLVLPNLMVVASKLKEYFKNPIKLYIPWNPKLLSYLKDINFFLFVKKFSLFEIDERYTGGYHKRVLYDECKTYAFEYGTSKEMIREELRNSISIIEKISQKPSAFTESSSERLLRIITEICHNACNHSGNKCFATFQSNYSTRSKYKKAYIAISDGGIGYYGSFKERLENGRDIDLTVTDKEHFLSFKDDKNLYAILEAIFYRKDFKMFGIYQVMTQVLHNNGVVRIHNDDTQLIFTKKNFLKYINNWDALIEAFKGSLKNVIDNELDIQFSPLRRNESRLAGVHIEMEIPLNMEGR